MVANPEVDIKQSSSRTVEQIAVMGVALVELVTGLRVGVEAGAVVGGEEGGGEESEDSQEAESSESSGHHVSHPLTARVPLGLSSV